MIDCPSNFNNTYCPGYWTQDLFTLPIEAGLVASLSYFSIRSPKSLGFFRTEKTTYPTRKPSKHTARALLPSGALLSLGTGALSHQLSTNSYSLGPILRGWIHAHLINEIVTVFSKNTFQRKRPFYDGVARTHPQLRDSDRQSFFSGHSSHAFTFAAYGSQYIWTLSDYNPWAWVHSGVLFGLASWVASTRAIDGQHHWSDVLVGAAVGTTIGLWTSSKALSLSRLNSSAASMPPPSPLNISYWVAPNGGGVQMIYSL